MNLSQNDITLTHITQEGIVIKSKREQQLKSPPRTKLEIKPDCLSCGDKKDGGMTSKLFKIACLAYSPSQILFEGIVYSRKELIN